MTSTSLLTSAGAPGRTRINGVGLHVEPPAGEGEPLVLVHGGWTDHTTWHALVTPLARSFRVVRYDRRGHSRSEARSAPSSRRHDEDDLAAIIEAIDAGPVHLVGTSYGAAIVLALAGRRSELVRSVVAHEPPLLGVVSVPAVQELFASVARQLVAGDIEGGTKRFFEDALGRGAWALVPEPVRRAAMGNAHTFVEMLDDPGWAALDVAAVARFPGPVTITYGDASQSWLRDIATTISDRIGRRASVIRGGHTPHHTHPGEFAATIAALVADQAPRRAA